MFFSGERTRRRTLIIGLQNKERQVRDLWENTPAASFADQAQRRALFGSYFHTDGRTGGGGASALLDSSMDEENEGRPSRDTLTREELKREQEEALLAQDRGLDSLHDVILRYI